MSLKHQASNVEKCRKIVAFEELTRGNNSFSQRAAADLLETPRSTIKGWQAKPFRGEIETFLNSPAGADFLRRIIIAAQFVIQFRGQGCRSLGEFISLSGLNSWVANSHGALHDLAKRFENALIEIEEKERKNLSEKMLKRKIVICEDEIFHQGRPCLVAIDALSNYILIEEYSDQRKSKDWDRVINKSLKGLNVEIVSVTSDEGTAISSHVKKSLKVERSSDRTCAQEFLHQLLFPVYFHQ